MTDGLTDQRKKKYVFIFEVDTNFQTAIKLGVGGGHFQQLLFHTFSPPSFGLKRDISL